MTAYLKSSAIALICAITPLTTCAQETKPAPKHTNYNIIPIFASDSGAHFFTMVNVEGKEYPFIIDSGNGYPIVVSKHIATALKKDLKTGGTTKGIKGNATSNKADFKDIIVGKKYKIKSTDTQIIPLSHLKFKVDGKEITTAGLIGSPVLAQIKCIIDYGEKRIIVPPSGIAKDHYTRNRKSKGDIVLSLTKGKNSYPFINIKINEKDLSFLIDTGSGANIIEPSVAEEMNIKLHTESVTFTGAGAGKSGKAKTAIIQNPLIAKRVQLPKMFFYLIETHAKEKAPKNTKFGGILGTHRLTTLKASLDYGSYSILIPKAQLKKK